MEIGKSEGKERGERRKRVIPGRDARSNNPREIRHGRLTASFDDSFSGRERASSLSRHSRPFSPFYFSIFLSILFFPPPPRAISALLVDIHSPFFFAFVRRPREKLIRPR